MTFWLIVVLVLVVGYFIVSIYRHDDSKFSKLTGYSYFDLWTNKKAKAANKLVVALDKVKGSHKVLVDLQVPNGKSVQQIDALLIHESGIYVIDVKKMSGWISGREQDNEWTQLLHRNKTNTFPNPLRENKGGIQALQEILPEVNRDLFETLILFTNDCSFQQIELYSNNVDVIKTPGLNSWVSSLGGEVLSQSEIDSLYIALEGYMQVKKKPVLEKAKAASVN